MLLLRAALLTLIVTNTAGDNLPLACVCARVCVCEGDVGVHKTSRVRVSEGMPASLTFIQALLS